jgi:hypothetical protein
MEGSLCALWNREVGLMFDVLLLWLFGVACFTLGIAVGYALFIEVDTQDKIFNECPNDLKDWCRELGRVCSTECLRRWKNETPIC